jgi:hypothetical protein
MKIGDKCKILLCNEDDNANMYYQGMIGTIVDSNLKHGCGEVTNDPMIIVKFDNGKVDGFWNEEIEVINDQR